MESATDSGKQVSKMMEWAKAAPKEEHNGLKQRKNGGGGGNMPKQGCSDPAIGHDKNTTGETLTSSQGLKPSRQATVKEVPDDDRFINQWSSDDNEPRTTQEDTSSSQPHAKDEPGVLEYCAHTTHSYSKLAVQKNEHNSPPSGTWIQVL